MERQISWLAKISLYETVSKPLGKKETSARRIAYWLLTEMENIFSSG